MEDILFFSISIPTYNRGNDLYYTILSVVNQSYSNWELNILDDSTDFETAKILNSFDDKRIKYYKNDDRLGLVRNWNECLKKAKYDFIIILHHDDFLLKDSLLKYKRFIESNLNAKFIHANSFSANLPYCENLVFSNRNKSKIIDEGDKGVMDIIFRYGITCSTVVIHRDCLEKVGFFDEDCWVSPDWEYYARITKYFKTYFLDKPTVVYVYHNNNTHTSAYIVDDFAKQSRYHFEKVKSYLLNVPDGIDEIAEIGLLNAIKGLAIDMFISGKYSKALKFFIYVRKIVSFRNIIYSILKRVIVLYKIVFYSRISYKELFENNFEKLA